LGVKSSLPLRQQSITALLHWHLTAMTPHGTP
jgi:hypothetical protein